MGITLDKIDSACASMVIKDSSGNELDLTGGEITVNATDLDIRDLTHVSDSVKIGDGTDFLEVNADGSINVVTTVGKPDTLKVTSGSVTSTNTEFLATPLANRCEITIQNRGDEDIFMTDLVGDGKADGVAIPACSSYTFQAGDGMDIFLQNDGGAGQDVRFVEIGT